MKKDRITIFLNILLRLTGLVSIIYVFMIVSSCDDNIYIANYNKDLEEIHYQMFEVDSLIMTIQMELDSLNAKN